MTKTTPERRAWLDALKAGDEVAIVTDIGANGIATVNRRTLTKILVDYAWFSARTGEARGPQWIVLPRIEPVTNEIRAALRRAEIYRSVVGQINAGTPTNVLELIELVLIWKNSPDVIVHAYDAILGLTKERMEAQR